MARTPAFRKASLAPGSSAHTPISARSFRGCATQDRKAVLPVWLWDSKLSEFLTNHVAQRLDSARQSNPIHWKGCKEVHAIGHYEILTDSNDSGEEGVAGVLFCHRAASLILLIMKHEINPLQSCCSHGATSPCPEPCDTLRAPRHSEAATAPRVEAVVVMRATTPTMPHTVKFRLTSRWPSIFLSQLRKTNYSLLLI